MRQRFEEYIFDLQEDHPHKPNKMPVGCSRDQHDEVFRHCQRIQDVFKSSSERGGGGEALEGPIEYLWCLQIPQDAGINVFIVPLVISSMRRNIYMVISTRTFTKNWNKHTFISFMHLYSCDPEDTLPTVKRETSKIHPPRSKMTRRTLHSPLTFLSGP